MCLASQNNHPTSLVSSWDISFLKRLVQQDPKGSNKVAHLFILDVYVSPNGKYVDLSLIYSILDFSFFMSQDDTYYHIHQNDPYFLTYFFKISQITPSRSKRSKQGESRTRSWHVLWEQMQPVRQVGGWRNSRKTVLGCHPANRPGNSNVRRAFLEL